MEKNRKIQQKTQSSHCSQKAKKDYLLWGSLSICILAYIAYIGFSDYLNSIPWLNHFIQSIYDLINKMWWGVSLGILMVAFLVKIPREFLLSVLGSGNRFSGILRAALFGILLDLCNHGILMVGAKLYQRGASGGQVVAFLIASPWNSFSLTFVLIALIGIPWTLIFIGVSFLIAILTGVIYELLTKNGILAPNPNKIELSETFHFWKQAKIEIKQIRFNFSFFKSLMIEGIRESRMVLRWIFFGIVLAAFIRASINEEYFQSWFGPGLAGLGLTVLVATLLEVCSEGSTPIAADLITRAHAPGNSFAFLMTGVSTDYTEIMVLKETTKSWKFALFLPLITLPQVLLIAVLMNSL